MKIFQMAMLALLLGGCASTMGFLRPNPYANMTLEQALAGATLGQCANLTKDYGFGPRPPAQPQAYWRDLSSIPCDANSRIGFVQTPEGRRLVVPAVPDAIPGQCWLKEVRSFNQVLTMHQGTAWLDTTRNSSRNDTRGKLFDCDKIPWEGGRSAAL